MTAQREDLLQPAWVRDRIDCIGAPEIEAPYFDSDLEGWVLSRHADVLAAFQNPSLMPGRRDLAEASLELEERVRLKMREEVRDALHPVQVRAWCEALRTNAEDLCRELAVAAPSDLIAGYARPLCLRLAAMVTGISQSKAEELEELAQTVSAATAEPENPVLQERAQVATEALRPHFSSGPESLRDSGFVGLSQTLVRVIGAAWYAFMRFPDQWRLLRDSPQSADQVIEELLRYGGAVRILSRTATENIDLNGAAIRKGERVLLRVFAASHDPARFSEPKKLDCTRRDPGHFTFGAGGHACVAANLNRKAAVTMTLPLLARFNSLRLARPVEWQGGSTMRNPVALWVLPDCS